MVKAGASRDYYADLEIPPTASDEEIKKAFRALAKALHPDRNPGNEIEVVPKFQAVQAANEILSDPEQRRKYDADRAKIKANAPPQPRRGPVPPTPSPFPPPPRRTGPTATRQDPFSGSANANAARSRPTPASSNSERYAPFARAGAQQWDSTNEGSRSKADAYRGFQHMKPGHSPTGERFMPTPPPRPSHHPTSARPASFAPHTAGSVPNGTPRDRKSWDDFEKAGRYTSGNEPSSTGFPGLSRSQTTTRRKPGFTPADPNGDEPQAPKTSAYASYARVERPQASTPQSYFPENPPQSSPQVDHRRPSPSPLRHARSSPLVEDDGQQQRPTLDRLSTRYSSVGGERTHVASGIANSTSTHNSPIDSRWQDQAREGSFASRSQERPRGAPSTSPKTRPRMAQVDSASSDSDTESDEGEASPRWAARPKATPRQSRAATASSNFASRYGGGGPTPAAHFPGTNYVKPPTARNVENGRYQYQAAPAPPPPPPPPPPQSQPASQAAKSYVPVTSRPRYTPQQGLPGAENGGPGPVPSRYGPNIPPIDAKPVEPRPPPSFPSSLPENIGREFSAAEWNEKFAGAEDVFRPTPSETQGKRSPVRTASPRTTSHSRTQTSPIKKPSIDRFAEEHVGPRQAGATAGAFTNGKFSTGQWGERLRHQAKSSADLHDQSMPANRGSHGAETKLPAKLSESGPPTIEVEEEEEEEEEDDDDDDDDDQDSSSASGSDTLETGRKVSEDDDPMDLDDPVSSQLPPPSGEATGAAVPLPAMGGGSRRPSAAERVAGMNMQDLSNVAPLKPTNNGLGDMKDLNSTLPFESKASSSQPSSSAANGVPFSSLKALNLPKPPKAVVPPRSRLDQEAWARYISEISAYMRGWHMFNQKMLAHFQARDAEISMTLTSNWTSALGDGPSGQDIYRKLQDDSSSNGSCMAGYGAYRQWMEEDMRVREWWNVACERHRDVVLELGKVRQRARSLNAR